MDEKILKLLNEAPEEGMGLLMEQYMGLLWSACRLYLNNPEDIRECVQETFLDFYEHRSRFQTDKGTIKAYLYVIAKRKALRAAGRNSADVWLPLDENMTDEQRAEDELLNREVLEQALNKLKEQDSRMIRMKYYEGMTCQEIARAMNLPLETVKKRQQRSLKKLRRILIALAVLGILTACAAAVVYQVRFSPSLGIQGAEEASWYEMTDAPITVETEKGNVTLQNVIWKEEKLYVQLEFEPQKFPTESTELYDEVWFESDKNGQPRKCTGYGNTGADGMLETAEMRYEYISETDVQEQYVFHIFDKVCTVNMKPIDQYEGFQEIGLSKTHNGRTIVLQTDRTDKILRASAYVYSENVWKIKGLNDLQDYYADPSEGKILWKQQKLLDEPSFYYETEVPDGEPCTLNIDTVLLQSEGETPTVQIPIPEDSADVDIPFTLGGDTYHITEIKWSRGTYEYQLGSADGKWETAYADELFIRVDPIKLEENTRLRQIMVTLGCMETRYSYKYNKETKKLDVMDEYENFRPIESNGSLLYMEPDAEYIRLCIMEPERLFGENIYLRIDSISKFWDQDFTFQIKP